MATFGRFTLEEKLATGGMAEVWLAHVVGTSEAVVVKRVLPHLASNESFNEMLLTEARVVMGLHHPNIVQVYDVGSVEGITYISMEYVPGSDLGLLMRRCGVNNVRVPMPIALRIGRSLSEALSAVHAATDERGAPLHLVHRDVSPQNVMISTNGETKLLDFGIVKALNELALTEPGTIKGKFAYMSPEQAGGRTLDGRSDLFSAGLVIYELLSGVRAHRRETEPGTYQAALMGEVPPLSKVWPSVPAELEAIVAKALSVDPDDRFQTGQELANALELCAEAADEDEVAKWSTSIIAARVPGSTPLPGFSLEVNEALLTVDARPPAPVALGRIELTTRPSLDLPAETPLSLPDEPVSLMPLATASSASEAFHAPEVEARPAAPSAPVRHLPTPRSPSFWSGLLAIGVGVFGLLGALNDPLDGFGQWLAPIGCAGLVLFGALAALRLFDRREALVFLPLLGVVLGLARQDALITLASGGLAAALWLGSDDDDEHELRSRLGLLAGAPALVLCLIASLGAWLEHVPAADTTAWLRRQGTADVAGRVVVADTLSFDAPGWKSRPANDATGATEFTKPDIRATLVARVAKVEEVPPKFEALLSKATFDFARRGWADFILVEHLELTDEADESHLVTFRVRRGLTWSTGTMRIARVDDQMCVLTSLISDRRTLAARDEMLRIAGSLHCNPGGSPVELSAEVLTATRKALVTLRSQDRVELGLVIGKRGDQLLILADDSLIPEVAPPALTYRPLLAPGDALRRALVLRRKPGALILLADAHPSGDLTPLPLVAPEAAGGDVVTLGLADEGITSRLQLRTGVLSGRTVTFAPHVRNTSGPIVTNKGVLVGVLRNGEGTSRSLTMAADVSSLLGPGLRTMAWKLTVDEAHQCTLWVRADLDDPFHELEDFTVLFGTPHQEEEVRKERMIGKTGTTLVTSVGCPLERTVSVGLKVAGPEFTSKLVDTVDMPTAFPSAMRGQRVDVTRPLTSDLTLLSWLFEPAEARKPACAIEECDRACGAGNGEACLALGQNLYNSGRANLAINDFERGCVAKSYEACIQLTHLATPKTIDTYTSVLKPWCELGIRRACVALDAPKWRDALKKENAECNKSREACDREADLLLEGPRRPAEVTRGRTVLDRRCRDGSPAACLRAGFEWQNAGKMPEAADAFERACKAGLDEGCVERAGLMAIGVNGPRNVEAAARMLKSSCDRGDARACDAIGRNKP